MADPDETTNGPDESSATPESEGEDLDVTDTLMHQVATLQELAEGNAKWLAALEPRIEAVEQRVASQLELGQDYNRLDAQVSGLLAAFDELRLKSGLTQRERETLDYVEGGEAQDPVVQFGPVEGSLATLPSGTVIVIDGQRLSVIGPAGEGTVKVRGGGGAASYLPQSRIPDEVIE